jgi:predicted dehydrogenase
MTTSRLRTGVIGVGHLGQHHARILAATPGVDLIGVVDARAEQASAVAERTGTRPFADYHELLDRVDAVSIAVPTFLHREIAGAFLDRGIATMVEKPLAGSLEEAEELVALSQARGALLQVGYIERFNPALKALEGMALRPKYITAERLATYTFRSTDIGVVLDLMIHDIDLLLSLAAAPVRSVAAVGVSVFGSHEDIANARVEFEDGCVANLTASRASVENVRQMRIIGDEGFASLDFATRQGTLIRPSEPLRHGRLELDGLDLTEPAAIKERVFGKILRVDQVRTEGREPLAVELEEFIQAARGLGPPTVNGSTALKAMRLADEVLRSLNSHAWGGADAGPSAAVGRATSTTIEPGHSLRGPISWRIRESRQPSTNASTR